MSNYVVLAKVVRADIKFNDAGELSYYVYNYIEDDSAEKGSIFTFPIK